MTTGAIYAHYATKAELLVDAVRCHGERATASLFPPGTPLDAVTVLTVLGTQLADRHRDDTALLAEALLASRRDAELAQVLADALTDQQGLMAAVVADGQSQGELAGGVPAEVVARFGLMLGLGSMLVNELDLPPVDQAEWTTFIRRLVSALAADRARRLVTAVDDQAGGADEALERSWIARLLRFERDGDTFTVRPRSGSGGRLFGGLIAAQALAAACTTVAEGKLPQSLHAYFVRGGRPGVDVEFVVERTRDGRSFDTRRITATQEGSVILEMLASFHTPEPGADWHPPAPEGLDLAGATATALPAELSDRFEIRIPETGGSVFGGPPYWIRTLRPVEDDPVIRACALTFMSDLGLMAAARPPGTPLVFGAGIAASLDHAIWFQRPFDPERWHCYQVTSLNNNDARGLAHGAYYDEAGSLIATMAQEALWRV